VIAVELLEERKVKLSEILFLKPTETVQSLRQLMDSTKCTASSLRISKEIRKNVIYHVRISIQSTNRLHIQFEMVCQVTT
jgi:uncharacterized radical SAM superfamily protein